MVVFLYPEYYYLFTKFLSNLKLFGHSKSENCNFFLNEKSTTTTCACIQTRKRGILVETTDYSSKCGILVESKNKKTTDCSKKQVKCLID